MLKVQQFPEFQNLAEQKRLGRVKEVGGSGAKGEEVEKQPQRESALFPSSSSLHIQHSLTLAWTGPCLTGQQGDGESTGCCLHGGKGLLLAGLDKQVMSRQPVLTWNLMTLELTLKAKLLAI